MTPIYLLIDGQQTGPFPSEQIQQMIAEGKASGSTPAWQEGMADWSTLGAILPDAFGPKPPPFVPGAMPPPPPTPPAKKGMHGCLLAFLIALGVGVVSIPIVACLAGVALGPITAGIKKAKESMAMQQSRSISLLLLEYSTDHNGQYPSGKTSTEIFQKLIDEKYAADSSIFYVAMPGKVKPDSNTLAAENVCFDVTGGVTAKSSDKLPIVYLTGYTVTYTAGATATCDNPAARPFPDIAVAYKGNSARILKAEANGDIPNFVPDDFTPGSEQYTQLKP